MIMESILSEIFNGTQPYYENIDYGEEYRKITAKYAELCEKFVKTLTKEQKKTFDELCWCDMGIEAEAVEAHYIVGFKLGFKIAVECMRD